MEKFYVGHSWDLKSKSNPSSLSRFQDPHVIHWIKYTIQSTMPPLHFPLKMMHKLTEIIFLASNDILLVNLGGRSDRLFLAGVCPSGSLRCLVFITVACSFTLSYSFFIKPLHTNTSTSASASFWSLN